MKFVLTAPGQVTACLKYIEELPLQPVQEVTISPRVEDRTAAQNRLQFLWYNAAAGQLQDQTANGYRAHCKLHFGVGILKAEDSETGRLFALQYDTIVKPLSYEKKIMAMLPPFELPVTSLMSKKSMGKYLEEVEVFLGGLGVDLPKPDDLYLLAIKGKK